MRKISKNIAAILLIVASVLLMACSSDLEKSNQSTTDKKETNSDVTENATEELTTEEQTTDDTSQKVIDGFYNCVYGQGPCVRIDFEVKDTAKGYKAIFYSQFTEVDEYTSGLVMDGERVSDNTYKFVCDEEEYTVVWDGNDKLHIEGTSTCL